LIVDCTVGGGGHSAALLDARPDVHVLGLDRDADAVAAATSRLARFGDRVKVVHGSFERLGRFVEQHGEGEQVMGILMDLGVSSAQLDRPERGFSFRFDAPLDMRMDAKQSLTATEVVNGYEESQLATVISQYGEERFARRIATQIVRQRARTPFTSTAELVTLLYQAIPAPARRTGGHPAKRTFQALRIAVNDELNSLRSAIPAGLDALTVGGRIVVLAYQSLEDRIVKRLFADAVASRTPVDLPVELPGHEPRFRSLTHGAERSDAAEIERNPRSAAVRLRAVQRVQQVTGKGDA
ncbi:MAG: 16S rRNA (cytosine(1402)-N(4))-methyltransferase RsmH, partial [Mycobacterium sp.]